MAKYPKGSEWRIWDLHIHTPGTAKNDQYGNDDLNLVVPADFPLEAQPLPAAPHFKRDVLLVVGENDTRTPPWMSQKIYDALPEAIYKELWIVPGARHSAQEAPEFMALPEFLARTISFMEASARRESL